MDDSIKQRLKDAWLNKIDFTKHNLRNPFHVPEKYMEEPDKYLLWMMTQPEYFSFFCKYVLGITINPTQGVLLKELWIRKFPMLIASRGFGKCIRDSFVCLDNGFVRINNLFTDEEDYEKPLIAAENVVGENGFHTPKYRWKKRPEETIKIKTRKGFKIECSKVHPIRILKDGRIQWEESKNVRLGDFVVIDRNADNIWHQSTNDIGPEVGYLFGCLVGNGGYTVRGRISFTTADEEFLNLLNPVCEKLWGKSFKKLNNTYNLYGVNIWEELFNKYGFNSSACSEKDIPSSIMGASKETMAAFIRGLMDTDGYTDKNKIHAGITSKSKKLIDSLHFVLSRFGIIASVSKKYGRNYYRLEMYGEEAKKFYNEIGFSLKRKQDILKDNIDKKTTKKLLNICNKNYYYDEVKSVSYGFAELYDFYFEENDHSYISGGFISHNSFLMGIYAAMRAQFLKNRKIIVIGAAFRQSKVIFDYIEKMWINSNVWRSLAFSEYKDSGPKKNTDMWKFVLGSSEIIFLPLGDGDKIRGQRANDLLVDEFNTIDENIFEIKIMPFTSVKADPIRNMQYQATIDLAEELGVKLDDNELKNTAVDNQIIISGTPGYTFQHFFKYYNVWKRVIACKGDKQRLKDYGIDGGYADMNPELFSITRIPWNVIPKGIMDSDQIIRGKHTMHSGNFASEFGAVFSDDSNGFFKRSLIEQSTVSPKRIREIKTLKGDADIFTARLYGSTEFSYVYGVDTASERDNFSVVILECHENHRRIVYSWVTRKDKHRELVAKKKISEENFYAYCARHIRNLMKKFPCKGIAIDEAGGGYQTIEALHDNDKMQPGELPLWPVLTYKRDESGHKKTGLHIIHPITFADATWVATANHGLKKDLEEFTLLFPHLDAVELSNAAVFTDENLDESLEDVMLDINELKDEMASIVHSVTPSGRERWDTPEEKTVDGRKARTRKDRYSALLMANAIARIPEEENPFMNPNYGHYGWAGKVKVDENNTDGTLYGKTGWYNLPVDIYDV